MPKIISLLLITEILRGDHTQNQNEHPLQEMLNSRDTQNLVVTHSLSSTEDMGSITATSRYIKAQRKWWSYITRSYPQAGQRTPVILVDDHPRDSVLYSGECQSLQLGCNSAVGMSWITRVLGLYSKSRSGKIHEKLANFFCLIYFVNTGPVAKEIL